MIRRFSYLVLILFSFNLFAGNDYYLGSSNPPCDGGSWEVSGNTYSCKNDMTLASDDTINASVESILNVKGSIYFENNTIGSDSVTISIESTNNSIRIINSIVSGYVKAKESININTRPNGTYVDDSESTIKGNIVSSNNSVRIINAKVVGYVDAKESININELSNGTYVSDSKTTINGYVESSNSAIRIVNAEIDGLVEAKDEININYLSNGTYVSDSKTTIDGNVESSNSSIRIVNAEIDGLVEAKEDININYLSNGTYANGTHTKVSGLVESNNNSIRVINADIDDCVLAKENVYINRLSNGTDPNSVKVNILGNVSSSNKGVTFGEVTEVKGDVEAKNTINVSTSTVIEGACSNTSSGHDCENQSSKNLQCGAIPSPNKLIAYYHFDESDWSGTSNDVIDSSGNGLHGMAMNGAITAPSSDDSALPSLNSMGTCGYGVFDNSSNQYVEVQEEQDNSKLDMDGSFTISTWVRPSSYPNSDLYTILSKDTNYEFHINSQGKVFWWWEDEDGQSSITSKNALPLDEWSFITIRYNDNNEVARLFIDAVSEGKLEDVEGIETNNNPLQIGQDQNYPGRAFDGFIDEVQIFDQALSKSEIQELMAQRHQCPDTPSLQCFTDNFDSGSLSNLWVTSSSKGAFTPGVVSNRLRFTEASRDQSTASSYQRLFPAANNLVEIEFDHYAYGGNGADGIAIVLSDATSTPSPGAFGGPLGYGFKSGEPGFAGGWLGIGIDEYGNFSNEGGTGDKPGRRRQTVALRGSGSGETGYSYLAGACNNGLSNTNGDCLAPPVDDNNDSSDPIHRYKIVVDSRNSGESNVEIFRKLGSGNWTTIVGPINVLDNQYSQADIPEDFLLSITGSTGGSTNIHEIDNFQVCALNSRAIEDQIDHFRLTHSGQELTCNAESVLVEACLDASCSSRYTDVVTAHLAPETLDDGGWVGGNIVTFSGGSASFDIRKNQIGSVTLGVTGSSPTTKPFAQTLCSKAGSGFSTNNCELEFTSSGFDLVVSDKIANLPTTATLKAGGNCGPGFANESKSIAFWSTYESPNASDIVGAPKVEIEGVEIGSTESTADSINVEFNASGEAQLILDYPDAGKLQLNVKYTGQSGEDDEGLIVEGDGQFVSFPQRLVVTAKNSSNQSGACTSANLNCSTFAKAGERFDIEVTAVSGSDAGLNRSEIATPNYSDSVGIEHLLIAPSGEELGELVLYDSSDNPITTESVLLSPGETKLTPATISEVGVFSIEVTPPTSYLGSNFHTIATATSANIGRFYPAYFTVAGSSSSPSLEAFCSTFSYIGQDFTYDQVPELYLEPKSVSGSITNNYNHTNWWNYSTPWTDRSYTDSNSQTMVFEGDGGTISEFASGRVYLSDEELIRYEKTEPPLDPFDADFSFELTASDLMDSDSVCVKMSDSSSLSDCLGYSFSNIDQNMELRWGRLLIHDTYGPEVSPIRQRIEVQHFENGRFTTNLLDSCTDFIGINNFTLNSSDYTLVTSGTPNPPEVNATLLVAQVADGESWIEFSAPGAEETGLVDTEIDLNAHGAPWLIEDLDGAGTVSGIAQFGIYRGNDRVIWWSEQN